MHLPNDLNDYDFQILNTIYRNQPIKLNYLLTLLPEQHAVKLRIRFLLLPEMREIIPGRKAPYPNTSYLYEDKDEGLGLTELGIKTLEDWQLQCNFNKRMLWEDRANKIATLTLSALSFLIAVLAYCKN